MGKTKISWTDESSNPIYALNRETGERGWACVRVSDGCRNCYASSLNAARRWNKGTGLEYYAQNLDKVEIKLDEQVLARWRKMRTPRKMFVCSMTDLFAEFVPDEYIFQILSAMRDVFDVQFQILTKRADRMLDVMTRYYAETERISGAFDATLKMPFPNVWLGVSVENQKAADERIPLLLQTPAAIRFLSCEPLLEEIDINSPCIAWSDNNNRAPIPLDWVIVGGESGPNFREMNLDWARSLRDHCREACIPFFFKQHSGYRPQENALLDGVECHEFPETAAK